MSRGVWRIFAVALRQYQRTLDAHALLDFSGVLERAIAAAEGHGRVRRRAATASRRAIATCSSTSSRTRAARSGSWSPQLVRSWGEGLGASADALPPSIFIVGDRKQSIYGFRDADVAVLDEAAAFVERLRPEGAVRGRRSRSASGRVPALLAFVNDVFARGRRQGAAAARGRVPVRRAAIGFPTDRRRRTSPAARRRRSASSSARPCARPRIAWRTRSSGCCRASTVRDRATGVRRAAQPADIAILFRSRDSHREFEAALERRGVSTYVYKGLGFFDADEIQDVVALLRYLADPGVEPARGDAAAIALRAAVGRRRRPPRRRIWPTRCSAPTPPAAGRARTTKTGACSIALRAAVAAMARRGSIGWRRPNCSTRVLRRDRRTRSRSAARGRAQARENLKKLRGHDPPRAEPRLRDAGADRGSPRAAGGRRRIERRRSTRWTPSA